MPNSTRDIVVAPAAFTVADLVRQFIHRRSPTAPPDETLASGPRDGGSRPAYRRQAEWLLKANVLNRIGQTLVCDVTRRELVELLYAIVQRGAPSTANRVYSLLKQCFRFAVAWDLVPHSPMEGMSRPGGRETPRTRVLSDSEIPLFWTRVESANMATPTKLGLKVLLVTAQRRADLTNARWSEFNLDKRVWTILAIRSSRARPHTVPLSQLTVEILMELRSITGNSTHVLASPRTTIRPASAYSAGVLSHAVRRNEHHWGIDRFTPYDLRRTAAAGMAAIGIPARHILKVLDHSVGAQWAFERHGRDYFQEKQAALNSWADHLERLLGIVRSDSVPKKLEANAQRLEARRFTRFRSAVPRGRRRRRMPPK
jgi:integrase